jgi:hypothetical protein
MPENETAQTQPVQTAPEASVVETKAETPPWGDDFDPALAWDKIQKANAEAKNLRERVMTDEQRKQLDEYNKLVEARKPEAERREAAAAALQRERDEALSETTRYKVALRHGITEDDFDLLGSGTEEQIEARATKVAAKNEAAKQVALESAAQSPTSRRPVEQLRAGATPAPDPVQSDQSLYPASWIPSS